MMIYRFLAAQIEDLPVLKDTPSDIVLRRRSALKD
jgi:hypothetical protein